MMTITERILAFARENQMFLPGDRVLCAVSGGADSVFLLHWLRSEAEALNITVCAAHFEHGIRGEEALRDAEFVRVMCEKENIPCRIGHGDVPAYAAERGMGTEEAARELRYCFLEKTADELGCNRIAAAHNAEDNAETILFHMVRGSGTAGLCGIPPVRGRVIRPLLQLSRGEIEAWLAERCIPHVEDSTNREDLYTRNRIRHRVMPLLQELNPEFAQAAGRAAVLLRQDEDCLNGQAEAFIRTHASENGISVTELSELHPAIASRVVRKLCPAALSAAHTAAVLALLQGEGPACADVPGLRVRRESGRLYFRQADDILPELPARVLHPGEPLPVPELGLLLRLTPDAGTKNLGEINDLFKTYLFKTDRLCGNISATGRFSGDRIRPAGRGCSKTLKQLFQEAGYTQAQRSRTLMLRDDAGLLAAVGLAQDERSLPQNNESVTRVDIFYMK